ncbi:hydroxyphenylacetyl-CoA thioesterase PaaI [Prauserella halophila]|uniref:Hydroxyphenylacetyl-CoA thioesterase PaaI n=2 Tax=Prauserella halophila TaxID=185641 RepID=A0ABP4GX29_9PSEU|nr:acyl-CoA thioesterase [Prauserella halophila]
MSRPAAHAPAAHISDATRTMLESDTASSALGIDVTRARDGEAVARLRITEQMVNGHDIAHGGYLFLLADTTFAAACNSHGPVTVASGAEISFVTSARLGDELVAEATERTRYGRNGIYDVTVLRETAEGREVVAEFRGRSRTVGQITS